MSSPSNNLPLPASPPSTKHAYNVQNFKTSYQPPSVGAYAKWALTNGKYFSKFAGWAPAVGVLGAWFVWPALTDEFRARVVPGYKERYGIKLPEDEEAEKK